jgi:hypothetical protein
MKLIVATTRTGLAINATTKPGKQMASQDDDEEWRGVLDWLIRRLDDFIKWCLKE